MFAFSINQFKNETTERDKSKWIRADFNGLFSGAMLCLSHSDTCTDTVTYHLTKILTKMDPDDLFASGTVIPTPDQFQCTGSKWFL